MRKDNYFGAQFFVPGERYIVITHRPDTKHMRHFFDIGEEVTCIDAIRSEDSLSIKGEPEFSHVHLRGLFVNSKGVEQTLKSGDVKRCR